MKLIVVSDTHGRYERLSRLMQMHRDADALIFLGDGIADLERADAYSYPFSTFAVRGNCDFWNFNTGRDIPLEMTLGFEKYKFLIFHGHSRSAKSGDAAIVAAATSQGADVVLFGHTHEARESYYPEGEKLFGTTLEKPLYLFNPGSLGASYDGQAHFGLIEIKNGGILTSLGTLKN